MRGGRALLVLTVAAAVGCAPAAPRPWRFTSAGVPSPSGTDGVPAYRLEGFFTPSAPVRIVHAADGFLFSAPGRGSTLVRRPADDVGSAVEELLGVEWGHVRGLAAAPDGRVWVAAADGRAVLAIAADGTVTRLALPEDGARVSALAWQPERERLWGADVNGHRLLRWERNGPGARPRTQGAPGAGPGEFRYPVDLALREDGTLLVLDSLNRRVQELDPDGVWRRDWPASGDAPLERPVALAIGADGRAWVLDDGAGAVRPLRVAAGRPLSEASVAAVGADLAIDDAGRMWIASPLHGRVYVYTPSGKTILPPPDEG